MAPMSSAVLLGSRMIGARSARGRSGIIAGIVALTLTTTACASTASLTVVPLRGQESGQVERDRDECEADAVRYRDRAVFFKTKVVAVIAGIVVGVGAAVVALVFANQGRSASPGEAAQWFGAAAVIGGGAGFVLGDVAGTVVGAQEHRRSESAYLDRYVLCLDERGYRVTP
jgi:hypothetical protein